MRRAFVAVVLGVLVLGAALLVAATISLGAIIRKKVETVGPRLTQTEVRLGGASVSLLTASVTLTALEVGNVPGSRNPNAVKVGTLDLRLRPFSLFAQKVHVTKLRLGEVEVWLEGSPTHNNLTRIAGSVTAAAGASADGKGHPAAARKGGARKLQVDDLIAVNTKVHLHQPAARGGEVELVLPAIHLTGLGEGADGMTAAELTRKLAGAFTRSVAEALAAHVGGRSGGGSNAGQGGAREAVTDTAGKAAKGIRGLVKKN